MGALGSRGVIFRDAPPLRFDELLSPAGDVNGDGLGDFLILVEDQSEGRQRVVFSDMERAVHLVYGRAGLPKIVTVADLETFSTRFARSRPPFRGPGGSDIVNLLAPAGDLDGDGHDDFFIARSTGAPEGWNDTDVAPGLVHLIYGGPTLPSDVVLDAPDGGVRIARFTSSKTTSTFLGSDIEARGDYNGDGVPDLAFGASGSLPDDPDLVHSMGRVYVLFGGSDYEGLVDVERVGRDLPGYIVEGEAPEGSRGEQLGRHVESPGDVNGDGLDDLVVATRFGSAVAYLIHGASDLPRLSTISSLVESGGAVRFTGVAEVSSVAAPGDLNGDGFDDLLIAISSAFTGRGAVYLVYGGASLPERVVLDGIGREGLGVVFTGEVFPNRTPGVSEGGTAGRALAMMHYGGDDRLDIVIGAPWLESSRGLDRTGKVYIVHGVAFPPGTRSLEEIETGELPGAVLTAEDGQGFGSSFAPIGDFDGDGADDCVIGAPLPFPRPWHEVPSSAYLVLGKGEGPDPLTVERVTPAQAPLAGGVEITIVGSGFDEETTVRFGETPAPVVRIETSARLVVEAPPMDRLETVDLVLERRGESAALPAAVRYVPGFVPEIDVTELPSSGMGTAVIGEDQGFASSLAMLDFDGDGLADVVASTRLGRAALVYGRNDPPSELHIEGLILRSQPIEGVAALIYGDGVAKPWAIGDVDADGHTDLAVSTTRTIFLLFGGERYEGEVLVDDLIRERQAVEVFHRQLSIGVHHTIAGGGDHDGDGLGDLAIGRWSSLQNGLSQVFFISGRTIGRNDVFLEDAAVIASTEAEDEFGISLAFIRDLDGDGRDELLVGAPGHLWSDGHAYLFSGSAFGETGEVSFLSDLEAQGKVRVLDSWKGADSLGVDVVALGDFNGDGEGDLALSAMSGGVEHAGESYVVFGSPELAPTPGSPPLSMRDLDGQGVRCVAELSYDWAHHLGPAGDFNGDGLDDLVIRSNNTEQRLKQGKVYVVFGGPARTIDLRAMAGDGVRILGPKGDYFGSRPTGGGDFNGDGLDDIVLSSHPARGDTNYRFYVVFGHRLEPSMEATFLRGDANANRSVELSDPVFLLGRLFAGGAAPPCEDAADANDDGKLDLTDAVFTLEHLFSGGATPPVPGPEVCGVDPTEDELGCATTCP